jgi:hypothetical protein
MLSFAPREVGGGSRTRTGTDSLKGCPAHRYRMPPSGAPTRDRTVLGRVQAGHRAVAVGAWCRPSVSNRALLVFSQALPPG